MPPPDCITLRRGPPSPSLAPRPPCFSPERLATIFARGWPPPSPSQGSRVQRPGGANCFCQVPAATQRRRPRSAGPLWKPRRPAARGVRLPSNARLHHAHNVLGVARRTARRSPRSAPITPPALDAATGKDPHLRRGTARNPYSRPLIGTSRSRPTANCWRPENGASARPRVWDVERQAPEFYQPPRRRPLVVFSPDEKLLAAGGAVRWFASWT
jgi:hypothetical protein